MSVWAAIVLTLVASAEMNLGLVLQKKGLVRLPDRSAAPGQRGRRRPRRFSAIWYVGLGLLIAGYALYVHAVSARSAPISLLQPVFASGLLVVAFLAVVWLHERFGLVEWLGVALLLGGVVLLGMSAESSGGIASTLNAPRFGLFLAGTAVLAMGMLAIVNRPNPPLRAEFSYAVLAGLLLGTGYLNTKVVNVALQEGRPGMSLVAGVCIAAGLISGLAVLQMGFRRGRALIVTAVNLVTNQVLVVIGGIVCLDERFPRDPTRFAARVGGLVAILAGILLLARVNAAAAERLETIGQAGGDSAADPLATLGGNGARNAPTANPSAEALRLSE